MRKRHGERHCVWLDRNGCDSRDPHWPGFLVSRDYVPSCVGNRYDALRALTDHWNGLCLIASYWNANIQWSLDQRFDSPGLGSHRRTSCGQCLEAVSDWRACKAFDPLSLLCNAWSVENVRRVGCRYRTIDPRLDCRSLQISQRGKARGQLELSRTL